MTWDGQHSEHPLRTSERPDFESSDRALRLVDLFCGCGGLTLGIAQAVREAEAALDIRLAVDFEDTALRVYQNNFPKATTRLDSVEHLIDGGLGEDLTPTEQRVASDVGSVDALVAGPPCQGHSNLNNHTRRADPKNELYLRVARAAAVLSPRVVMVENVPAVRHDTSKVVASTITQLEKLGYQVFDEVLHLDRLGVAQRRRRHVLLATSAGMTPPTVVLNSLANSASTHDLRWAIGDLAKVTNPEGWDQPSRVSLENLQRMRWLLDNDEYDLPNDRRPICHQGNHSYKSMYGRLHWDQPAQTLTSGFGSIGQGRYMHPDEPRALTPHEAARIQGFPDYFQFVPIARRGALATMIGNAVPPALGVAVFEALLPELLPPK